MNKTDLSASRSAPKPLLIVLILVIGIVAISFSSIFIKWTAAPVAIAAMWRLWITNALLFPFAWRSRRELKGLTGRDWTMLFGSGAALGLHFLFWMESLRYTSVASSTALLALEPVLVMIGSLWVFKQRTDGRRLASMGIAVLGAIAIGWGDFGLSARALQGDLLSLIGTAAVAFHMLFGQSMRGKMSAVTYSSAVFFIAGGVLAAYSAFRGFSFVAYSAQDWTMFGLLAVVPTILGHYLFNWLLKYMHATSVSMAVLGEPLGSTLLAFFLLGEVVTPVQFFAGALLIGGVWMFIRRERKEEAPEAPAAVAEPVS
ncbi:DMT family transporter [Paenibacillus gansuensis]|uniref:DMT family transporter n=1 Tax=Paenibacillus gansuensis TaxID=306542 RepID=A0ABW5PKE9_9BACL